MALLLTVIFALLAAGGVAVATGLLRFGSEVEDKYAAKLARIQDHAMSLEEIELSRPFSERFLIPFRDRLVELATTRTPASRQQQLRNLIARAGDPYGLTVGAAVIAKVIAAAAVGLIVALVFLPFVGLTFPANLLGLAAAGVGWIGPDQWLKQQANRRRQHINDAIPDTIDLLTICLDAGLSFDAAMQRIADKVEGPLRDEMAVMLTEVRYGRPRDEALQALAERVGSSDLTAFVSAISQSQKLGTSIGETVRIQAGELRRRRRQGAEEKAAQASLKMLFPMIGCIFPTLFIVLMGPVALILISRH